MEESVTSNYGMDDVNSSEIVVENAQGERSQLVVDPGLTASPYRGSPPQHFSIDSLENLSSVNANVATATQGLLLQKPWHR